LSLIDGVVKLEVKEKKSEAKPLKEKKFELPNVNELIKELPLKVKKIIIEHTDFSQNSNSFFIESLAVNIDEEVKAELSLENIQSDLLEKFSIDHILLDIELAEYKLTINTLEMQRGLSHF